MCYPKYFENIQKIKSNTTEPLSIWLEEPQKKFFLKSKCNKTEVASNKSGLLLKIILQNTQTLQIFTINIKT